MSIRLELTKRTDERLKKLMPVHYSQPKGFVGRTLAYAVLWDDQYYGHILAGSATRFLPGRNEFFGDGFGLQNVISNTFFHVEKVDGSYPCRWFTAKVVKEWRRKSALDWRAKYKDRVIGFETLIELPRTGSLYLHDGWEVVGTTKGYTCKRVAGKGTDSWTGKRVWDMENLRPKLVLCRHG